VRIEQRAEFAGRAVRVDVESDVDQRAGRRRRVQRTVAQRRAQMAAR